jgi:hypothetical protein
MMGKLLSPYCFFNINPFQFDDSIVPMNSCFFGVINDVLN